MRRDKRRSRFVLQLHSEIASYQEMVDAPTERQRIEGLLGTPHMLLDGAMYQLFLTEDVTEGSKTGSLIDTALLCHQIQTRATGIFSGAPDARRSGSPA